MSSLPPSHAEHPPSWQLTPHWLIPHLRHLLNPSLLKLWGQTVFLTQTLWTFFPKKKDLKILLSAANRLKSCPSPFLLEVCKIMHPKWQEKKVPGPFCKEEIPYHAHVPWTARFPGVLRCWALSSQVAGGPGAAGVFLSDLCVCISYVCQNFKRTGKPCCKSSRETSGACWWW